MGCEFFFIGESLVSLRRNVSREDLSLGCEHLLCLSCEKLNLNFGEVKRDVYGKPYLEGQDFFFSFSHSKDVVCCVVNKDSRVGIDIQFISEKLLRVKSRFLNPNEIFFEEKDLEKLCQIWCIKEAVFKAASQHLVSLKDIFIKDWSLAEDKNGFKYNLFCSRFEELHLALAVNL